MVNTYGIVCLETYFILDLFLKCQCLLTIVFFVRATKVAILTRRASLQLWLITSRSTSHTQNDATWV
jgi:hypothetical protein